MDQLVQMDVPLLVEEAGARRPATAEDLRGPQGVPGQDGTDGAPGVPGADGVDGAPGAPGAPGADGLSAYEQWLAAGNSGTASDFLAALKGAKGDTGSTGSTGATGPTGPTGADGRSAYEVWLAAGNVGTVDDYLASLHANADAQIADEAAAREAADALLQPLSEKGQANGYAALDSRGALSLGEADTSEDGVNSRLLIRTADDDAENAITVKRRDATMGTGTYGTGQVLELLKDQALTTYIGYTAAVPGDGVLGPDDDLVLFRVTPDGALGLGGNLHLATGLRQPQGYGSGADTGGGCLHVQPYVDVAAISVAPMVGTYSKPVFRAYNGAGTLVIQADPTGQLKLPVQGSAGGLVLGGDVELYRSAANILTVGGAILAQGGINAQPSPAADLMSQFLSGNAANYSALQIGRAAGEGQFFVAPSANFLFTGTAAGDIGVRAITGALHLGSANGAAELRIADNALGFYGTAPQTKKTVTGSRAGNAALASLLTQLAAIGLLTDSSTA